ncbi:MAG TPA: hypothetical protein VLB27_10705, partial [candidate division Zixibacteria bacterium]|nr:hypothetical protein [candidate division Zixibacteria bacterium]
VRERISRFVRQGGLLLILGQPEDWPPEALPVRIAPTPARLEGSGWEVSERAHRVFSTPYTIYTRRLTETVGSQELSVPATIEQGKKLITDQRGRALVTVINMGEGQIIYCGFPLLARIGALEINAIHLLANLVSQ